jgi:uncharacterized membrane protein
MFGLVGILGGILLILVGIFLAFFFQAPTDNQPESMGYLGIVLGLVLIVVGFVLIFF